MKGRGVPTRRLALAAAVVAVTVAAALPAAAAARVQAQGGGADALRIFAAASLTEVFPKIDKRPTYNFASSNSLLQQLRQGAPADVFAAASPREPAAAYREGLCEATRDLCVQQARRHRSGRESGAYPLRLRSQETGSRS